MVFYIYVYAYGDICCFVSNITIGLFCWWDKKTCSKGL